MAEPARERFGTVFSGPYQRLRVALAAALALAAILAGGSGHAAPASPITVTKTPSATQIASGQQLKYTIVVTNSGGSAISNVVMTDQVNGIGVIQSPPALPQFTITSTKGSCTQGGANGNLITCNAGNMAGGESWTVTIGGQVTAGAGTTLNNTATVTGTKSSQTFTTPSNSTQVQVTSGSTGGQPDLTINKTGPTSVTAGAAMTYTLTVNNIGSANTSNVKVIDTLPAGVGFVSTSTTSLFQCSTAGTPVTVTCTGGAVNAGQNGTITINATAPATAGQITNTAVVDPDNTIAESNELNNTSATVYTTVGGTPPPPLLSILKTDGNPVPTSGPAGWWTGAGPDPVNPGQKLTYKILVTNNATGTNSTAGSVAVVDSTQGLDASSIVATQTVVNGALAKTDGCVVTAPQVKCTVKTLNSGGTIAVTIVGTVVQSAGSTIFNTATVTGNVKNTGVTNTASEATTVRPAVDLSLTKSDSPDPVCARSWPVGDAGVGDHLPLAPLGASTTGYGTPTPLVAAPDCLHGLTYAFVVGNSGNAAANGVTLRDPLPAGEILDSYSTDGGFVCGADVLQVVTCSGGTIPAASTRTIKFMVVAPPNVGTITNTATVDPNNTIFESDETNNTVSETTTVVTGVDLVVWKGDGGSSHQDPPGGAPPLTEGFDPIATSGTDTYTIVVDNIGTQDTTGIKVVDTLPAGTKFLSATTDGAHSFTCSSDGALTVTCVGGQLKGTESEFYNTPGTFPPSNPGDDFATIKIKIFATPFVQPAMHNVVVVDPDNTIPEANELNNSAVDDTKVTTGDDVIGAFNQLTVQKTQASPAGTVATNGTLVYDLQVDNKGTDPVSNVVVKDTLPTGTRFISAVDATGGPPSAAFFCSHDGSATGGVVTCIGGDFSGSLNTITGVGITRHIKLTVFAPGSPGAITNHATVDPDNVVPEGNEFDNDAFTTTNVDACVDLGSCSSENAFNELTIQKTQVAPSVNPVARNSIVTYELKVSNLGTDPAHSVTVTDRLPAGFRFIDAKDTGSSPDPNSFTCGGPDDSGVLTCSGGSLSGQVTTIPTGSGPAPALRTIRVRVFAPDTPGTYTNQAFVDPNNTVPEGNEFNNQDAVQTIVTNGGNNPYIDLQIKKTGPSSVFTGGHMEYDLHVSNAGEGDAFNVKVTDVLPPIETFFNAADFTVGPGMFTCAFSSGVVTCTGGTIPAHGSRDIRILAVAPAHVDQFASNPAAVQVGVTNQAFVDPDNSIPEGDETNNSDSVDTSIKPPLDLSIKKEGPDSTTQNSTADYKLTVTETCPSADDNCLAQGVAVHDALPVGMIVLNVTTTDPKFQCQVQQNPVNVLDCLGAFDKDNLSVEITVHVFMTLDQGSYTNVACVDPANAISETDETNNCSTKLTVVSAPDLEIKKTAVTDPVTIGQTEEFDLHVSNIGTADATGVTVHDTLDSGLDYVNATATNGFTCTNSSQDVTCTGDLSAGSSTDIQIQTKVNSSATNPISNTATVDQASGETNTANNSSSVTVSLGAAAVDLVASANLDAPDPINTGQVLTYKGTVLNNGTAASGTFHITESIPAGVAAVSASATNGFTCTLGSPVDCTGSLAAGDNTTITVKAIVTASPPATLTSTLTADSNGDVAESDETNNTKDATTTVTGSSCSSCTDAAISAILSNPADPATVSSGDTITYTFAVSNVGDTKIPGGVSINASVDPQTTLTVETATNGYSCTPSGHTVTCSSGADLAANQGTVVTITVTVDSTVSTNDVLTAQASVDPVFGEFSTSNNGPVQAQITVG